MSGFTCPEERGRRFGVLPGAQAVVTAAAIPRQEPRAPYAEMEKARLRSSLDAAKLA